MGLLSSLYYQPKPTTYSAPPPPPAPTYVAPPTTVTATAPKPTEIDPLLAALLIQPTAPSAPTAPTTAPEAPAPPVAPTTTTAPKTTSVAPSLFIAPTSAPAPAPAPAPTYTQPPSSTDSALISALLAPTSTRTVAPPPSSLPALGAPLSEPAPKPASVDDSALISALLAQPAPSTDAPTAVTRSDIGSAAPALTDAIGSPPSTALMPELGQMPQVDLGDAVMPTDTVAPSLGPSGSVPTYDDGRGSTDAPGSAVPAVIEDGVSTTTSSMEDARNVIKDAAAARMEAQGGAPFSQPTLHNPTVAAIHQAQAQYGPMVSIGGAPVGGEQTGQNIGALLAALGVK